MIVLGDFNIAPEDRDVHDPLAWHEQVLCSTPERAALARLHALGLHDSFRLFEQEGGRYSWWDYRQGAFRRNLGMRIDLILVSAALRASPPRGVDRSRHAHLGAAVRSRTGNLGAGMSEQDDESGWPAPLDDADLEALDRFLRAHGGEDDLLLDGVHGLLTAISIGPQSAALPDEWLPEVLHEPFADEDEGRHILGLLARLNESVELELESDSYEPILGEVELDDGDTTLSAHGWCEGFFPRRGPARAMCGNRASAPTRN